MNQNSLQIPEFKGSKVLIAEDEEINFLFIEALVKSTGAEVFHAWNGQQAIDIVKKESIDLVLMDIKMPIMDGYMATREIKKINPKLPVIAQTAYALGDDKFKCIDAGCDEYITKPIRKNSLFELLSEFLSG